jgi:hypothetical protein
MRPESKVVAVDVERVSTRVEKKIRAAGDDRGEVSDADTLVRDQSSCAGARERARDNIEDLERDARMA